MLITVGSLKGSPGATSTALALAAGWPRPVVVLEADPSGADLALRCESAAGGPPQPNPSLVTLGASLRAGGAANFNLLVESQRLACGVNLIQGPTSHAQARGLGNLWSTIADACRSSRVDVIVDAGRLDPASEALAIAKASHMVVVVAGRSLEAVLHLREGIGELLRSVAVPGRVPTLVPVLVGPDSHAERDRGDVDQVLREAGLPVTAALSVAYDPKALARLEAGESPKKLSRSVLMRSAVRTAAALAGPDPVADQATAPAPAEVVGR